MMGLALLSISVHLYCQCFPLLSSLQLGSLKVFEINIILHCIDIGILPMESVLLICDGCSICLPFLAGYLNIPVLPLLDKKSLCLFGARAEKLD